MLDIGTPARIDITDIHGRTWTVSGAGVGAEGVELAEDPQGLFDEAPISGIWQQSAFQEGSTYLGHTIDPIDLVLGFDIYDKHFRFIRIVNIEREIITRHHPIKSWRNHT